MNWIVFALIAWIMLGFEEGFRAALQLGSLAVTPSFVLVLIVFVSLWARPMAALAVGLILGVMMDLVYLVPTSGGSGETVAVVGPWALGGLLAAYTVLNFRGMVFRHSPLTMGFLCAVSSALAQVLVLAILTVRSHYDIIDLGGASNQLWQRLGSAAATGILALVMAPLLNAAGPLLGFRAQRNMAPSGRRR